MGPLGGIQASGGIAWEGITQLARLKTRDAKLVCYDPYLASSSLGESDASRVSSKMGAIVSTFKTRQSAQDILIWHLGLLKIVPFIPTNHSRVILFLHGIEAWCNHGQLTNRLLKRVDLFLSNSDYTWKRFVERNPSLAHAAHRTVPLGIGSFSTEIFPAPSAAPVALMISRLSKNEDYKGHREVLHAWPTVCSRIPAAELWIVGDGDLKKDLELAAGALGLKGNVRFLGSVSEERKQELISQCRCFVLPSRGEGFGLVYLEAMRAGRPCLVSTLDAGREVVNPPEAGLAADPGNRQELADAISGLMTHGPEWQQWSEQARRRYEQSFTARHFQERLLDALFPESEGVPAKIAEAAG